MGVRTHDHKKEKNVRSPPAEVNLIFCKIVIRKPIIRAFMIRISAHLTHSSFFLLILYSFILPMFLMLSFQEMLDPCVLDNPNLSLNGKRVSLSSMLVRMCAICSMPKLRLDFDFGSPVSLFCSSLESFVSQRSESLIRSPLCWNLLLVGSASNLSFLKRLDCLDLFLITWSDFLS